MPADERVDDRVLEHVAHVERPGDVRRRDHQREIVRISRRGFGVEQVLIHPPFGPVWLEALGLVDFLDFHGEVSILPRYWRTAATGDGSPYVFSQARFAAPPSSSVQL